jgi:hypothetical protein
VFRSNIVSRVVAGLMAAYPVAAFRYGNNADRDAVCETPDFDFAVRHSSEPASVRLVRDLTACPSIRTHGHGKLPPGTLSVSAVENASTWSFFSILDIRTGIDTDDELRILIDNAFRQVAKTLDGVIQMTVGEFADENHLSYCAEVIDRVLSSSHAQRRSLFDVAYVSHTQRKASGNIDTLNVRFWLPRSSSRDFVVKRRRRVIHHFCRCVLGSGLGSSVKSRLVRLPGYEKPVYVELKFKLTGARSQDTMSKLAGL